MMVDIEQQVPMMTTDEDEYAAIFMMTVFTWNTSALRQEKITNDGDYLLTCKDAVHILQLSKTFHDQYHGYLTRFIRRFGVYEAIQAGDASFLNHDDLGQSNADNLLYQQRVYEVEPTGNGLYLYPLFHHVTAFQTLVRLVLDYPWALGTVLASLTHLQSLELHGNNTRLSPRCLPPQLVTLVLGLPFNNGAQSEENCPLSVGVIPPTVKNLVLNEDFNQTILDFVGRYAWEWGEADSNCEMLSIQKTGWHSAQYVVCGSAMDTISITPYMKGIDLGIKMKVIPDFTEAKNLEYLILPSGGRMRPKTLRRNWADGLDKCSILFMPRTYAINGKGTAPIFPPGLKQLHLGSCWVNLWEFIDHFGLQLPQQLQVLHLPTNFDEDLCPGVLPSQLKVLSLGNAFNRSIGPRVLPPSIQHLIFGVCYDKPLKPGLLTSSLKRLEFGKNFNQPLPYGTLPEGLEELVFDGIFGVWNQTIFRPAAREPHLGCTLPSTLRMITFSACYDGYLGPNVLPARLHTIVFGAFFSNSEQEIGVSDPRRGYHYLPPTLVKLVFPLDCYFFSELTQWNLPHSLRLLCISKKWMGTFEGCLPGPDVHPGLVVHTDQLESEYYLPPNNPYNRFCDNTMIKRLQQAGRRVHRYDVVEY